MDRIPPKEHFVWQSVSGKFREALKHAASYGPVSYLPISVTGTGTSTYSEYNRLFATRGSRETTVVGGAVTAPTFPYELYDIDEANIITSARDLYLAAF